MSTLKGGHRTTRRPPGVHALGRSLVPRRPWLGIQGPTLTHSFARSFESLTARRFMHYTSRSLYYEDFSV
jgi:hypothetical protein